MEHIRDKIRELRSQYETLSEDSLPIDVFTFMEIDLRLNPIPFPSLYNKFRIDAALTSDFESIYLDAEQYDLMESGPIWRQHRLRFTVAHELAHFFLHREEFQNQNLASKEGFVQWTTTNGGNKFRIEQEANEFAGRLLVPENRLAEKFDEFAGQAEKVIPDFMQNGQLRDQFSQRISSVFAVNAQVIAVRLERDGIWPSN